MAEATDPGAVRLTRRGRVTVVLAGLLVLGTLVVLAGLAVRSLAAEPDCTVRASGRTVGLDRAEAERVTAGRSVRVDLGPADARAVAAAVSGSAPAALTCRDRGTAPPEADRLDDRGLTERATTVRSSVRGRFGPLPDGGFAPGGVSSGHMPGSAHYEGRAIDVFFRPVTEVGTRRGWALAHYLVAHARRLAVDTVIFDGRVWTARRAGEGWREYRVDTADVSRSRARILEHRDHVHVDVAD